MKYKIGERKVTAAAFDEATYQIVGTGQVEHDDGDVDGQGGEHEDAWRSCQRAPATTGLLEAFIITIIGSSSSNNNNN